MQVKHIAQALLILAICFTGSNVWAGMVIHFRPDEPIHMQSLTGKAYDFDLDFNGVVDFILRSDGASFWTEQQNNNAVLGFEIPPPNIGTDVARLDAGAMIDSTPTSPLTWGTAPDWGSFSSCMEQGCIGLWAGTERQGYFGTQFDIDGSTHYGWVYLDNTFAGLGGGDIIEWAYESTPGIGIIAGAIPEPSTISLLIGGLLTIGCTLRRAKARRG